MGDVNQAEMRSLRLSLGWRAPDARARTARRRVSTKVRSYRAGCRRAGVDASAGVVNNEWRQRVMDVGDSAGGRSASGR